MKTARALPVLMYHHVSPSPGLVTISPAHFAAQIDWLKRAGWQTVGCAELAAFLDGASLPAKSVLLSFDDGYLDNYVHAHPILAAAGMRAVLFGISARFGEGPRRPHGGETGAPSTPSHAQCHRLVEAAQADAAMLRWSELEYMRAAGTFEVHSHTHTHTRWDRLYADAERKTAALADDLAAAQTRFAAHGIASTHLCWPQGYYDTDYLRTAAANGYCYLYTTEPGTVVPATVPTRIPRIVVKDKGSAWLAWRLRIYASPWLARAYGWSRGK